MKMVRLESLIQDNFKGITPSYVDNGSIIVLNQKCIRNNTIDYSFARFHNPIKEFSNKKVVQVGDILINSTGVGTAGRCAFVRELPENKTVITDSHILTIRIADFYQAGCIEYLLFGMEKILQTYMDGSTGQGEFDKQRLYNIEIPEFKKPKFIYEFLTNLENKITLNNQINTQLEQMAKTLYDYWFVQFDFPNQDGKPYKSSGGKMVYNETLKRETPEGWGVGKLGDIINLYTGKEDANFATENGKYPFFTCGEATLSCDDYVFDTEAILLAGNGSFAIKRYSGKFNAYQRTYVLEAKNKIFYPIIYFCLSDNIQRFINGSRGSIIKFITKGDIENIQIALPNDEKIFSFEIIRTFFEKQKNLEKQTQQLTQLRDFLLPMLMNGQVGVGDD